MELKTFPQPQEEAEIQVRVRDQDGKEVGTAEKQVEWDIPNVNIEGLNIDYSSDSLTATISEEKMERAQFRAGTSIEAWNEIRLDESNVVGGVELKLEDLDTSNYEDDNDLIPYSVVRLSGENVEGLELDLTSNIPYDWLVENDLIVSRREADVSYYRIEDENGKGLEVSPTTRTERVTSD
ncbi:MAG: hypothetical protein ABEJ56_03265 [Candidatus Nanohaloarchaea archaeon]